MRVCVCLVVYVFACLNDRVLYVCACLCVFVCVVVSVCVCFVYVV